ncbi:MAG: hypothetical protein U0524_03885, partial [Candidatus Saccharimonadales bacterium]
SPFVQGGNSFGATAVLGTGDANALSLVTGGVSRLSIASGGTANFTGDLTVATNKLTVASATGNTAIAGTLAVTGSTTLTADLAVNGGNITSSAATVNLFNGATPSAINLGTSANAKTITIGNATGATALNLTAGTGNVNLKANRFSIQTSGGTETFAVNPANGNTAVGGGLTVTNNASVGGTLTISTLAGAAGTHICINGSKVVSTCSSSAAYKKDITALTEEDYGNVLGKIANTEIFTYRWKDDATGRVNTGVISEHLPVELIQGLDSNNNPIPDWTSITGYLWAGTRELAGQVNALRSVNTQQTAALDVQSGQINDMNATIAGVSTAVNSLTNDVNDLNNNVSSLNGSVSTMSAQIQLLQGASGEAIKNGDAANLTTLTVTGSTSLNSLSVVGSASISQNLTVAGLTSVQDIIVGGHLITAGSAPTKELQTAAGAGATIAVNGNDTLGTITITTGATGLSSGDLAKIIFSKEYGLPPRVLLSPANDQAAGINFYRGATDKQHFYLTTTTVPTANTTYVFDYFIGQSSD